MAAARVKKLQEALTCSICLDYFKDPAILKCGHNFCRECITKCSAESQACPECREPFQGGELQPNRQLRDVAEITKEIGLHKEKEPGMERVCEEHGEALQIFCQEEESPICLVCQLSWEHKDHAVVPLEEAAKGYKDQIQKHLKIFRQQREEILAFKSNGVKESQELLKQTDKEKQKTVAEFKQLHQFLEEQERLLLAPLEEINKLIVQKRDEHVAELSAEISSLGELISEMEEKCRESASEFLQDIRGTVNRCKKEKFDNPGFFSLEFKQIIWESSQRNPFLKSVIKQFRDTLSPGRHWDKANVTLDPNTAHSQLILSEDLKSVRRGDSRQKLPEKPERFDPYACVLGCERFTSGRRCWEVEVEVGDEQCWAVGVARESATRKGDISLSSDGGIWAVCLLKGQYQALTASKTPLSLSSPPRRIRVCLDCVGGRVTFVDAHTEVLIFTFPPASFSGERIRPWLWLGKGSQLRLCS
uniref:Zinc finger protein RFP-like n=1 Tax=Sphenodon punctatus TaxID=8508 RepID=A0A8D0H929_SPHPU